MIGKYFVGRKTLKIMIRYLRMYGAVGILGEEKRLAQISDAWRVASNPS